jgi:hypothetical protein
MSLASAHPSQKPGSVQSVLSESTHPSLKPCPPPPSTAPAPGRHAGHGMSTPTCNSDEYAYVNIAGPTPLAKLATVCPTPLTAPSCCASTDVCPTRSACRCSRRTQCRCLLTMYAVVCCCLRIFQTCRSEESKLEEYIKGISDSGAKVSDTQPL